MANMKKLKTISQQNETIPSFSRLLHLTNFSFSDKM